MRCVMQTRIYKAAVLGAALVSAAAWGADWELNPSVEAGYLFDDNYRLTSPGTEIDVQGPVADASLEMRARMPSGEFSFTPRIRATYFPNERDLDTTDYFASLDWQHRGQRLESRIRGEFAQQDVINSEQPDAEVPGDADLGDADFGDAGRVLVENRRTRASLRPTFNYELSPRRALEFGANFANVSFDEEIPGAQVDYRSGDLTAGLVARLSEINSLTTRVRGARFDIDTQGDSTSYGLELQWDRRTAADTRAFLRAGAQNVEFESGESNVAWLAGAGVNMPSGRNTWFADLSRSVGPSSAGNVITRDQLRLRLTRDMTPRLALLFGVRGTHDEDISDITDFTPRSYATGDVGVQWRWAEEFSLRAGLDYTWQEFEGGADAATSSGANVSVLYQPIQRRR